MTVVPLLLAALIQTAAPAEERARDAELAYSDVGTPMSDAAALAGDLAAADPQVFAVVAAVLLVDDQTRLQGRLAQMLQDREASCLTAGMIQRQAIDARRIVNGRDAEAREQLDVIYLMAGWIIDRTCDGVAPIEP
ncbi:MAG: hypothetical protein K2X61_09455 [Caulobacteraceae bacterium]|nr:hypothetical protein [Caulobacteraceae bacterium]